MGSGVPRLGSGFRVVYSPQWVEGAVQWVLVYRLQGSGLCIVHSGLRVLYSGFWCTVCRVPGCVQSTVG